MREPIVLFEPWSLGDALIAAWAAASLQRSQQGEPKVRLACAGRFHALLQAVYPDLSLIQVDLPYTQKSKGRLPEQLRALTPLSREPGKAYSIRGDIRDWVACKRLFPAMKIECQGWAAFIARRSRLVDLPFELGVLRVKNRYARWTKALGTSPPPSSRGSSKPGAGARRIWIHLGAQWMSKRYPYALELAELFEKEGHRVELIIGPGDAPPSGGRTALLLEGKDLVESMRRDVDLLICNDSSPMHLGFALGLPTAAFVGITGPEEWTPPGVLALSPKGRSGYRPRFRYDVDQTCDLPGVWIPPHEALRRFKESKLL